MRLTAESILFRQLKVCNEMVRRLRQAGSKGAQILPGGAEQGCYPDNACLLLSPRSGSSNEIGEKASWGWASKPGSGCTFVEAKRDRIEKEIS